MSEQHVPAPASHDPSISIVIPALNEAKAIGSVLESLTAAKLPGVVDIIVVDDGSEDGTAAVAAGYDVRVVHHGTNRGYGAALKSGLRAATGEFVLTMDADGQHRIEDVAALCAGARESEDTECIIGRRLGLFHSPAWRMPGKWLMRWLAEFLTKRRIPDLNSGLRIFRRDIALRYVRICPQGFSFSTTLTMAFLARGIRVDYLPIRVEKRVGKTTVSVATGFEAILLVIRLATLFNPLRVFLPASAFCMFAGFAWGARYVMAGEGVTVASMLAILTGVLLFALGLISDQVAQLRLERFE